MRNLKKLLAVVVAICVLATFTVPAFAETKTDAQIATDLGVIKGAGTGVTAEYLATTPDRLQGAIMFLRLKGLEDTAKAFVGTDNFADVEGLNDTNQAILAYLKANPDLGFAGVGDNKFSPLTKMTAKEYYKVMLVALGYVYETDFTWANVLSFAASKGLIKNIDKDTFTVNDLCIATVEALGTPVKGGTDKLIAKLVDGGSITSAAAVASGLYTAVAKALEIVSATADNMKVAKIVFNKELNSDTIKADNFIGPSVTDPKLLDDKKTVLVVLTDKITEQSKSVDITVKNVKSADGVTIVETKKSVKFEDTTIPVVSGVVAKNAKTLVITSSEALDQASQYVKVWDGVKIDGTAAIGTSTVDYAKNTLSIDLASLMTVGTHKIEISGLKDFAGYVAVATTFNIEVAADTTAPAITSAKANSPTEIEVTFSEDVDRLNTGKFWVNGTEVTSTTTQDKDNAAKFVLKFTDKLTVGATVEVIVAYQDQKDVAGNKVATKTNYTFKVADDTALPTVVATIGEKNKIVLTFSKAMLNEGTLKVFKSDGTTQLGTHNISLAASTNVVWTSGNTVCTIAAAELGNTDLSSTDIKDIVVKVTGAKDATIRANALADYSVTLKALDTKAPGVLASYTTDAKVASDPADDTITFYFSEAMDADTMKNLSNYVVTTTSGMYTAGSALSTFGSDVAFVSIASDAKSITFKAKSVAALTPGFSVYAIKDLAGNMMTTGPASLVPTNGPAVSSVVATGSTKLEVNFDQDIGSFAPGAFLVTQGPAATSTLSAVVIAGAVEGKKVTLTLDRSIGTETSSIYLSQLNYELVKNAYGTKSVTFGGVTISDKIAPTVTFEASGSAIKVKFSEAVTTSAINLANEITLLKGSTSTPIDNTTISAVNVDTKTWMISGLDKNTDYTISIAPKFNGTADGSGNLIAKTDATAITTKE